MGLWNFEGFGVVGYFVSGYFLVFGGFVFWVGFGFVGFWGGMDLGYRVFFLVGFLMVGGFDFFGTRLSVLGAYSSLFFDYRYRFVFLCSLGWSGESEGSRFVVGLWGRSGYLWLYGKYLRSDSCFGFIRRVLVLGRISRVERAYFVGFLFGFRWFLGCWFSVEVFRFFV